MIIATIILLTLTLLMVPLPTKVRAQLRLRDKKLDVSARLWGLRLIEENIKFAGSQVVLTGTLDMEIDLFGKKDKDNSGESLNYFKCLTLKGIYVETIYCPSELDTFNTMLSLRTMLAIATPIVCGNTNLRINVSNKIDSCDSYVKVKLSLTTSILDSIIAIIKEGVRVWNIKLAKLSKRQ